MTYFRLKIYNFFHPPSTNDGYYSFKTSTFIAMYVRISVCWKLDGVRKGYGKVLKFCTNMYALFGIENMRNWSAYMGPWRSLCVPEIIKMKWKRKQKGRKKRKQKDRVKILLKRKSAKRKEKCTGRIQ